MLQGTGNPGGVVNLVKKRPVSAFAIGGTASAGSWNNYGADVDVTGPLAAAGGLRGRLVLAAQDRDYYYDVADDRHRTAYGILELDPLPQTTLSVSVGAQSSRSTLYEGLPPYPDGTLPAFFKRSTYVGADWNGVDWDIIEENAELSHKFSGGWVGKVTLENSSSDIRSKEASTFGVNPANNHANFIGFRNDSDYDSFGVDLNFSGPINLFDREHTLLIGFNRATASERRELGFTSYGERDLAILSPDDFDESALPVSAFGNESRTHTSGLYATARIKILDPLTVVLGSRWTDYSEKSRSILQPVEQPWQANVAKADKKFTPYGGVIWDVTGAVSLYASYASIFAPQSGITFSGDTLPPRIGWQKELGIKGDFFDHRLNASLAVFRIHDTNRAVADLDPSHVGCGGTPGASCSIAAGLVQSQGWDAEVSGSPVRGLELSAGYTRNDAKYLKDADPANVDQPISPWLPRELFKLWSNYRFNESVFAGALNGWNIGAGLIAQSRIYNPFRQIQQKSYATGSVQVGYRFDGSLQATLTVNNRLDRSYLATVGGGAFYGEPRNITLTLRRSF